MNVTFLIGNGFDLRLDLKTSFKHMYKTYIDTPTRDPDIMKLQDLLRKDAPSGYETWGDFELAMGKHTSQFPGEGAFINCVRDFKDHMVEHLKVQEARFYKRISDNNQALVICANEMERSVTNFHSGQTPNVIRAINRLSSGREYDLYKFVVFNYTTTLDAMVSMWAQVHKPKNDEIIHIHGTIGNDIVLGVDNPSQLSGIGAHVSRRLERAFMKPRFNEMFDTARTERASQLISTSDVLCIYGMALGESDRTWIDKIVQWLLDNEDHHLIYYMYNTIPFNPNRRDEMMDEEDAQKQAFLQRICKDNVVVDKVFNQVHIPIGHDIFDFHNKLLDTKAEKRQTVSEVAASV